MNNNLEIGGVQKSLENLLLEIGDKYDITLLVFHATDEQKKLIPENVKVITVKSPFKYFGIQNKYVKKKSERIAFLFWKVMAKIFGRSFVIKLMSLRQGKIKGFDVAISYLHEGKQKMLYGGCNEFVLKKVEANKKIGWIHCDFSLCGANNKRSRKIYKKYDQIITCSDGAKQAFLTCLPELDEKCVTVRNCNDYKKIIEQANIDPVKYDKDSFNIVTVARIAEEKGIERALQAIRFCKYKGFNLKYHLIGSGKLVEMLKKMAKSLEIDEDVFFYGAQDNPYRYMKNADLFMLTSYHEAAPMVFDEASCLALPILATKTTSTDEMVNKSNAGFVCENSQKGINEKLLHILENRDELDKIKQGLLEKSFNNHSSTQKFDEIINS